MIVLKTILGTKFSKKELLKIIGTSNTSIAIAATVLYII